MLLALIVWIGGIIFFAFVEAPTVFHVPSTLKAWERLSSQDGDMLHEMISKLISRSLTGLHWIGIVSGLIFLICSLLYNNLKHAQLKPFALSQVFIVIMLVLTAGSQFGIMPRMEGLRANTAVQADARSEFDRLHAWSTRLEGGVLLLGLGVVVLTARRFGDSN
jgi:Domain of unknown function (DUF4149)